MHGERLNLFVKTIILRDNKHHIIISHIIHKRMRGHLKGAHK